jgi:hypothetical protein
MRKIKLLILLSLAGLQLTLTAAANGPKHPDAKRRGGSSTTPEKSGRWGGERKRENVTRPPERGRVESKSATREERRPAAGVKTREKTGAWDRRQQKSSRPTETERRVAERRGRDKTRKWETSPQQKGVDLKPSQRPKLIEHLFGGVRKKGEVQGFHYEGSPNRASDGTSILKITKPADARGVYSARVKVRGVEKTLESTFFPRAWSRTQVLKAVDQAYANRDKVAGRSPNYREGKSADGMRIGMLFNKHQEIVSAFPIREK